MNQTKSSSLAESFAQSFIGYWLNIVVQIVIYPLYGAVFTMNQNVQIGLIFMVVSIARGYVLRRAFDAVLHRQSVTEGWNANRRTQGSSRATRQHQGRSQSGGYAVQHLHGQLNGTPAKGLASVEPGQTLRGLSTLIDMRDGSKVLQWVKTSTDDIKADIARNAVHAAMSEDLPRYLPSIAPGQCIDDLMSVYVLTDYHLAHLHSDEVNETALTKVERHRTLAPPDAYAAKGGWISGMDSKVITYSKQFVEISRLIISPDMVRANHG